MFSHRAAGRVAGADLTLSSSHPRTARSGLRVEPCSAGFVAHEYVFLCRAEGASPRLPVLGFRRTSRLLYLLCMAMRAASTWRACRRVLFCARYRFRPALSRVTSALPSSMWPREALLRSHSVGKSGPVPPRVGGWTGFRNCIYSPRNEQTDGAMCRAILGRSARYQFCFVATPTRTLKGGEL